MKLLRLVSKNIKRISAVEIEFKPDEPVTRLGGRNSQGKSSALDSVAYLLGGVKMIPAEPIRHGETEAVITADLGEFGHPEFIVTRRFTRDHLPCSCGAEAQRERIEREKIEVILPFCIEECNTHKFGPAKSTLSVKAVMKDGHAKYSSPQALLDGFYNALSFDPMAFRDEEPKKQNEILRRLANIDTSHIENERSIAADRRRAAGRDLDNAKARLAKATLHPDTPEEELPRDEALRVLREADELRGAAAAAEKTHDDYEVSYRATEARLASREKEIEELEVQLQSLRLDQESDYVRRADQAQLLDEAKTKATAAKAKVPDVAATQAELDRIERTNAQVRDIRHYRTLEAEVNALAEKHALYDGTIKDLDAQKVLALTQTTFPVAGLGLTEDGVTFNGVPFEQAGEAEKLRVSVAIGFALNPKLKLLLVRNGNLLDDDGRKELVQIVEEHGGQVIEEYVTRNDQDTEGVSVMIVDGHVAE